MTRALATTAETPVLPRILLRDGEAVTAQGPAPQARAGAAAATTAGLRVVIAGGGTGGHLFPGIALAEEIRARGGEVHFVGTARGIEARAVPENGYPLELIDVAGIKGRGVAGLVRGLLRLPRAWWQSLALLRRLRPDVVVGVGGYASGPVVATASMLRIPTAILEQNSIPGITNRILSRLVRKVFCTFLTSAVASRRARSSWPATRSAARSWASSSPPARPPPRPRRRTARACSCSAAHRAPAPSTTPCWPPCRACWRSCRASRSGTRPARATRSGSRPATPRSGSASRARVAAFLKDMAAPYAWCDLVLCRAGATSLSELTAVGKPAVLVPFPHATDNHQEWNARALVDAGGALLLRESEWTPDALTAALAGLLQSPERLQTMSNAMRTAARPEAARTIVDAMSAWR
ncbi:UDP-N-acetylglucosamine--N-acetylmuramyl-(pentapeptide) pyrophosphoryl-undecaprenol N-acetylglucosamine transferase [Nannocystis pusilla]|uniref:UDP-N-acetylglucosamine--N-acetylmuramyl-(pentapeptide) pyrophosphoryl-undecaprenol N-acetylglucosamine transferase n=1 Tax=Nannocystis pusilla TaxID=889268 RepID=A0A9X3EY27_9BACT|nr:UDP-N-acetylglucosamine--N-acetylmuramyl-(pentapeptide) pyrophosphoryl-undecaprenol N-acetylglucosamine transferase [Nannocystis pusilla]MCY1007743.1 UDP-N-acetylglucosamine--N-acetylmuramyl-(pentapeptide) pyrophosphoryl-undecaprenol N-acetylglucosamine transferase [Nannocystis pusilla]